MPPGLVIGASQSWEPWSVWPAHLLGPYSPALSKYLCQAPGRAWEGPGPSCRALWRADAPAVWPVLLKRGLFNFGN